MSYNSVAVSAPGKVLLAGGYLVLDRAHTGLVFGLDARIHILVQPIRTSSGVVLSQITVRSPQFLDAVWEYGYRLAERDGGIRITPLRVDADLQLNRNPFIETALGYALSYISKVSTTHISPAAVTILADNDYYSSPANARPIDSQSRFLHFGVPITKAHKTGLGSSAALVTSFIAAILSYYLPPDLFDLAKDESRRRLHNLAQAAHCAAQGKVGSGFDVASAVYGSCLYRRFSPSILTNHVEPGEAGFGTQIHDLVDERGEASKWDTEIRKDVVKVPQGLRLVLCDVSCGSQTPGMVKKVLAWRKAQAGEADALWMDLQSANDDLATQLRALADSKSRDHTALKDALLRIRALLRSMSEKSDVPIEPKAQTALIDACSEVPGVIGGVVPGAGGYDAIALLIEDQQSTIDALQKLLSSWKFDAGVDGAGEGKVGMLGVREEMAGVQVEDAVKYQH